MKKVYGEKIENSNLSKLLTCLSFREENCSNSLRALCLGMFTIVSPSGSRLKSIEV